MNLGDSGPPLSLCYNQPLRTDYNCTIEINSWSKEITFIKIEVKLVKSITYKITIIFRNKTICWKKYIEKYFTTHKYYKGNSILNSVVNFIDRLRNMACFDLGRVYYITAIYVKQKQYFRHTSIGICVHLALLDAAVSRKYKCNYYTRRNQPMLLSNSNSRAWVTKRRKMAKTRYKKERERRTRIWKRQRKRERRKAY